MELLRAAVHRDNVYTLLLLLVRALPASSRPSASKLCRPGANQVWRLTTTTCTTARRYSKSHVITSLSCFKTVPKISMFEMCFAPSTLRFR